MAFAIRAEGLHKTYRIYANPLDRPREALFPRGPIRHEPVAALTDVSFEIPKGETVGLLGRNGSGKSTLLNLITGILHPTAGALEVKGSVQALLELGAGFDPLMTGRENVLFQFRTQGLDGEERNRRLPRVEAFADIGAFFDRPVRTYSSGMFARLAFASAIQGEPDILILDEILAVGDASFQEKCFHHIRGLRDRGTTILFVSHDTDQVSRLCQSALLLEEGRLVTQGPTRTVVDAYHAIVYGAVARPREERPQPSTTERAPESAGEDGWDTIDAFRDSKRSLLEGRSYYNASERRMANGVACLDDILVLANGMGDFSTLTGQEDLSLFLKVTFAEAVRRPHLGWAITTRDGLIVSGGNTLLSNVVLPGAAAGETVLYEIGMSLSLVAGDYFLNLGVNAMWPEWTFLDTRRAVIHLAVRGSHRCTGFFEIPTSFEEVTRIGAVSSRQQGQ